MSEYNAYSNLLQSTQAEFISSETLDSTSNQISVNNSNNNLIYNSAPLIFLNSQKSDVGLLQNSVINDGSTYLTIQTQPNGGANELNGAKLLNTPIIIQSSPTIPIQTTQYQQQSTSAINVQPNAANPVTSLTSSQLQSLSYLMQTQITPQFIQTSNGLIQIIPHGLIATQNSNNQLQNHNQDQLVTSQLTALPTLGWSLNNFNTANNQITIDNQIHQIQLNNLGIPQLIPLQQIIQPSNSFFNHQNDDQNQIVSTIVDLNTSEKKSIDTGAVNNGNNINSNKKGSRRKRKPTNKIGMVVESSQLSSPLANHHPTSTNEVMKEVAESSSSNINNGMMSSNILNGLSNSLGDTNATTTASGTVATNNTLFDNKGRPFSFLCPECPKKFTLNSRLNAHMRCHTGMRPFTCNVCAFSFTQKSYLIRHAAVHKEERPFHCEKCQKSYKHYGSLANHRKLHRKDEKNETEIIIVGNDLKLESSVVQSSYNGSSKSSSIVIGGNGSHNNNGNEYGVVVANNQNFETNKIIVSQEIDDVNHGFTITSSSVHSTTGSVGNSNGGGSSGYIKDLDLYPITLSQQLTDNNVVVVDNGSHQSSGNVFFQTAQSQLLDQSYSSSKSNYVSNSNTNGNNNGGGNGNMLELSSSAVTANRHNDHHQNSNEVVSSVHQIFSNNENLRSSYII